MASIRQYEREPLDVFAIDADMNRATGSIPYTSLQWLRRYNEPGQFSMEVPASVYDTSWAYICTADRPETGMVQKVEYSDTSEVEGGIDTVTVSGFFMEEILNRMVFLVEGIELEKVIVPRPSAPGITRAQQPTYYTDDAGNLYYKDKAGYFTKSDGTRYEADGCYPVREDVMKELMPGFKELDYSKPWDWYDDPDRNPTGIVPVKDDISDPFKSYYYETPADKEDGTITSVRWDGEKKTVGDVLMRDDKGNALIERGDGTKGLIWGIVDGEENTYRRQKEDWERRIEGIDDDGQGYYMKEVMGPWSTLELDDLRQKGDNVRLVTLMVRRKLMNSFLFDEPTITGEEKVLEDRDLSRLGDWVYKELGTVGASPRVFYSFEHNTMVFQTWRGKDRTQEQDTWPWAVFSDTWGTLHGFTASKDDSGYRNKCYVLYEYDEPVSWSGGKPAVSIRYVQGDDGGAKSLYRIPYETKRGIATVRLDDGKPDMEAYLDLRGEKPAGDGAWGREEAESLADLFTDEATDGMQADYEAFAKSLEERGKRMLTQEHGVVTSLDTGTLDAWRYMDAWDLGDKVDMAVSALGLVETARITGVDEVYESGKAELKVTVGDELLTEAQRAARTGR